MRRQRGNAATELVLVTPVVLVLLMFAVFLGRITVAQSELQNAAHSAARAASIARTPSDALAAARQMAAAALGSRHVTCAPLTVGVDTTAFRPGGDVIVTVACTVDLADLGLLRIAGAQTLSTSFTEPVDRFEGLG